MPLSSYFRKIFDGSTGGGSAEKRAAVQLADGSWADAVTTVAVGDPAVNRSGAIAAGGTPQVLMPANPSRRGWMIQNLSTGDLWINDLGNAAAASQPSLKIPAGALYETPPHFTSRTALSLFGTVTGQAFSAREF